MVEEQNRQKTFLHRILPRNDIVALLPLILNEAAHTLIKLIQKSHKQKGV